MFFPALAARGGRLIIVHGTGDYCVTPERTAQWFETMQARMGKEPVRAFARYYAAPGLGHLFTGSGADAFPLFGALPELGGAGRYTRPVCEYGTFPKYAGTGDSRSAASYACTPTGGT